MGSGIISPRLAGDDLLRTSTYANLTLLLRATTASARPRLAVRAAASYHDVVRDPGPLVVDGWCPRWRRIATSGSVVVVVLATAAIGSALAAAKGLPERAPVQQLPPGLVTLAHVHTPDGVVGIGLHRIRYLGKVRLCVNEATQPGFPSGGPAQCANYPIGPTSGQGIGNAPIWIDAAVDGGSCPPQFAVVAGILLRPGLTAWVRGPHGFSRMREAAIPKAFNVAGPLVYTVVHGANPLQTIVVRNASGKTISKRSNRGAICST